MYFSTASPKVLASFFNFCHSQSWKMVFHFFLLRRKTYLFLNKTYLITLLRHNSHTIHFVQLKDTVSSIFRVVQAIAASASLSSPKKLCTLVTRHPSHLQPCAVTHLVLSAQTCQFWTFHINVFCILRSPWSFVNVFVHLQWLQDQFMLQHASVFHYFLWLNNI